ncbi:MAG: leucine-rich repeat protein [Christensenellaceae bacterium]|jgi:uncharacterized repeat protein (TIGR02543 family)|nr:leucine-rich repeat protein [Christensenellaceae bacterium]
MSSLKKLLMFLLIPLLSFTLFLVCVACKVSSKQTIKGSAYIDSEAVCLLTVNLLGGGENYTKTLPSGYTLYESLEAPHRDGYDFLGWYKDSLFTSLYDFTSAIYSDTEIFARWEQQTLNYTDGLSWFSIPKKILKDQTYKVSLYLKNISDSELRDVRLDFDDGQVSDEFSWDSVKVNEMVSFEFSITPTFATDNFSYISEYFSRSLLLKDAKKSKSIQLLYAKKRTESTLDSEIKFYPFSLCVYDSVDTGVSIKYRLSDNGDHYSVLSLSGAGALVIPDTFNDKPVTKIGPFVSLPPHLIALFESTNIESWTNYFNTTITSIEIGSNIKNISNFAFFGCVNVTQIKFKATSCADLERNNYSFYQVGVKKSGINVEFVPDSHGNIEIPGYLFSSYLPSDDYIAIKKSTTPMLTNNSYTPKITSIYIPNATITRLGAFAFAGCDDFLEITGLNFNDSKSRLGEGVFFNCTSLKTVSFKNPKEPFSLKESVNIIDFYEKKELKKTLTLTKILPSRFFQNCVSLSDFNALEFIEKAGAYSFYNCLSLSTPKKFSLQEIGDFAFFNSGLTEFSSGETFLYKIGKFAFSNSLNLKSIGTKNSIKVELINVIDDYAFSYCPSLSIVKFLSFSDPTLGQKYYWLGYRVFYKSYANIYFEISKALPIWQNGWNDTSGKIYFGVTDKSIISEDGFDYIIQNGYASIIKYSGSEKSPEIKATVLNYPIKRIASNAFSLSSVETISFKSATNMDLIEPFAFLKALSLKSVDLRGVTQVGRSAFSECAQLSNVIFPSTISHFDETSGTNHMQTIPPSMFEGCSSLTDITLPTSIVRLGSRSFSNCVSLKKITAPDSLEYAPIDIAENTPWFSPGEKGYKLIYLGRIAFAYVGKMPRNASIEIMQNTWYINESLFKSQVSLGEITIPETIKRIGKFAFYDCTNVKTINYNAISIENLNNENQVFYNTGKNSIALTVNIGSQVLSIPNYLFCPTNLVDKIPDITRVNYPKNVSLERIGLKAFYHCDALKEIIIPKSVTSIASSAFYYAENAEIVRFYPKRMSGFSQIGEFSEYLGVLVENGTTIYIGSEVEILPAYLFSSTKKTNNKIQNVIFEGKKVVSIGDYCFYYANLLQLRLPDSLTTLGKFAFFTNDKIEGELTIPSTVSNIGDSAFESLSNISSLTLGEGLASIGANAFKDCSKISAPLTIPSTTSSVGNCAFYGLSRLETIFFSGVNNIKVGDEAFRYALSLLDFSYDIEKDIVFDLKAQNWLKNANEKSGFNIHITSRVIKIPNQAFKDVGNVKSLNFAETKTLTSIGDNTFEGAFTNESVKLVDLTIPSGVKTIGSYAFNLNSRIKKITTPISVVMISPWAFSNCENLALFSYGSSIPIDVYSGEPNIVTHSGNLVVASSSNSGWNGLHIEISNDTTCIPNYMFFSYDSSITSLSVLSIQDSKLVCIGKGAFSNLSSLKNISLNSSLEIIDSMAFYKCVNLKEITLPESLTSIGYDAFSMCYSLEDVYFNSYNLLNSDTNVFYLSGSNAKTDVTFHVAKSVKLIPNFEASLIGTNFFTKIVFDTRSVNLNIAENAFSNWDKLSSITLPIQTQIIDSKAFANCSNLVIYTPLAACPKTWKSDWNISNCPVYWGIDDLNIANIDDFSFVISSNTDCAVLSYKGRSTNLTIPATATINSKPYNVTRIMPRSFSASTTTILNFASSVTHIDSFAFENSKLVTVNISKDIISIGAGAFSNASLLENINVDTLNPKFSSHAGVLLNKLQTKLITAPRNKSGAYVMPNTVTTIEMSAFQNCILLSSITITENVNEIGNDAFKNTKSLSTINYDAITIMPFYELSPFAKAGSSFGLVLNIGKSVKVLPDEFFNGNTNLTTVNFTSPSRLESIGAFSFSNNTALQSFAFPAKSLKSIGVGAFYKCSSLKEFAYTADSILPLSNLDISDSAFSHSGLSSLTLQSNVISIGNESFSYTKISKLDLRNATSLKTLPSFAFSSNPALSSVLFSLDILEFESFSFSNCQALLNITIPENTQSIGSYAFLNAYKNESLTIPKSVTEIGVNAFFGHYNLSLLNYNAKSSADLTPDNYVFNHLGANTGGCIINIGENVESIPDYLFYPELLSYSATKIKAINILTKQDLRIGQFAFSYIDDLRAIGIPKNVLKIQNSAFYMSMPLTIFTMYVSMPSTWSNQWNISNLPVVWGRITINYTFDSNAGTIVSPIETLMLLTPPITSHPRFSNNIWVTGSISQPNPVSFPFFSTTDIKLYAIWGNNGRSFENAFPLFLGVNPGVGDLQTASSLLYYSFTPNYSRTYTFLSKATLGDPIGYLYYQSQLLLTSNDDGGGNGNFKISYSMTEGITYYLGVRYSNNESGPIIPIVVS